MVSHIINSSNMIFVFPSEIADHLGSVAPIVANEPICWINNFNSYYYPGNELQIEAIKQLYLLQSTATYIEDDLNLQKDWQYLQTSDHIHLMDDQHPTYYDVNITNSIFKTKYDAFINYMNILDDFRLKLYKQPGKKDKKRTRKLEQKINSQ